MHHELIAVFFANYTQYSVIHCSHRCFTKRIKMEINMWKKQSLCVIQVLHEHNGSILEHHYRKHYFILWRCLSEAPDEDFGFKISFHTLSKKKSKEKYLRRIFCPLPVNFTQKREIRNTNNLNLNWALGSHSSEVLDMPSCVCVSPSQLSFQIHGFSSHSWFWSPCVWASLEPVPTARLLTLRSAHRAIREN